MALQAMLTPPGGLWQDDSQPRKEAPRRETARRSATIHRGATVLLSSPFAKKRGFLVADNRDEVGFGSPLPEMLGGELFLFGIYSCYVSAFDLREKGVERGEDGEVDGGNVLVPGGVRGRRVLVV
ncbi:hypothetical protein MRB53_023594 [Persea americana]|uniref:Uncharacterized protein n=1 Tax=Persea americana TaxID=3435 RepID=A0ACC2LA16_PERAE|nr:hypothetical protein MRB53_023594 [Persea americana]